MKTPKKLAKKLDAFSKNKGADLFGVANLKPVQDFIISHGDPVVAGYPRAVSLGMQLSDTIVEHHSPDEPRAKSLYWHHVYDVVSERLNSLAYDVTRWLTDRGFGALPVPASTPYDFTTLQGIISHKLAAHLAGLGWIGKNCLLLTKEFGPRIRFITILTDAPLAHGRRIDKLCGECRICIDACPVSAFTDVEFDECDDVEVRFDTRKCSDHRSKHPCGLCVSTCPIGTTAKTKRVRASSL